MANQADVRRLALGLPEVVQEPGRFSFAVAGKSFAWVWMERTDPKRARVPNAEVIAVRVANQLEKDGLLALDTEVFFSEPHYDGYPAVLVRLPAIDVGLLAEILAQAWRSRAPKHLVEEAD
jgi:hypothetical protein